MLRILLTFFVCALACTGAAPATQPTRPVLRAAYSFDDGGGYNTKWAGSGTPIEVRFDNTRILAKGTAGTYCCGYTFAVVMRAAADAKLLEGKSVEQVKRFQKEWYGAVSEPDIREKQCAVAMTPLGIGHEVSADDARPGDFLQFWRTKSGHSVIFLGWEERDEKRIGFKYRSSQGSTNGIGDTSEFFKDGGVEGGEVDRNRLYFGRLSIQ
jgi:hypothetical protein